MSKYVYSLQLQMREPAELGKIVKNIESQFSGIDATVKVNVKSQGVASTIKQVKELKQATMEANSVAESLAKTFAVSFKRFVTFSLATRAVGAFTSGLGGAFNEAVDFEKQMVRVSQVTGKTLPELRDLNKEITRLSVGLGVSSKTLLNVSLTLAQAGFSANDTRIALEALAKTELAPTFTDIAKTTEGAIALFNQFGAGAEALAGQLGAINKVSADFAVESDDLIDVVRRVGGVFKSSGGSLNELLAIFTSIRATTRESAESIGTALKTIFVRVQRPQTLKYLKDLGVDLVDLEGKFVGPLKATELLNKAFGKLEQGDPKFIQISEELGGYRQIGKVIPLLQQYAVTQKALESAKKGQGSLDADAAKAQETLANKIVKVKEEFASLIRTIYESPVFQLLANSSLQFASALIKVADSLKNIVPLIGLFATLKIAKTAGSFVGAFGKNLKNPQGFADGGPVPGTGSKDSVPAMLMPGEFVLNKKTVSKIGMGKLNAINNGGSPETKNGVQFFANGGYVGIRPDEGTVGILGLSSEYKSRSKKLTTNYNTKKTIKGQDGIDKPVFIEEGSSFEYFSPHPDKSNTTSNLYDVITEEVEKGILATIHTSSKRLINTFSAEPEISLRNLSNINKPSPDSVRSLRGYMFESVASAITGLDQSAGNAPFDFNFDNNKSVSKDNLSDLFGEPGIKKLRRGEFKPGAEYFSEGLRKSANEVINTLGTLSGATSEKVGPFAVSLHYKKTTDTEDDKNKKLFSGQDFEKRNASSYITVGSIKENQDQATLDKINSHYGTSYKIHTTAGGKTEIRQPTNQPPLGDVLKFGRGENLINIPKFLLGKAPKFFATGGPVLGSGNKDSVPAMLTPGEFVLNKKAVKKHGMSKLMQMNGGGASSSKDGVQYFKNGGQVATGGVDNFTKLAGISILVSTVSDSLLSVVGPATDAGKALSVMSSAIVQGGVLLLLLNQGLQKASDGMDDFRKAALIKKGENTRPERLTNQISELKNNNSKLLAQQTSLEKKKQQELGNIQKVKGINEQLALNKEQQVINSKRIESRAKRLPEKPVKLTNKDIEEIKSKAAQAKIQLDANNKQLSSTYSAKSIKANADKLGYRKEYDATVAANLERSKAPKGSVYASVAEEDFKEKAKALRDKIDSKKIEQNKKLQEMIDRRSNLPKSKKKFGSSFDSIKNLAVGVGTAGLVASQGISQYGSFKDEQTKKDITEGNYDKARENKSSSVYGGLLSGAVGGAAGGAAIGSLFGPVGTVVGGVVGGLSGFANELSTVSDKMKTFNLDIFNATIESSNKSLKSFNDGLIKIDAFTNDLQKNFKEGSKANDEAFSQATLGEKAARYNPFKGVGSYENAIFDPFAYVASGVEALGGGNDYKKNVYGKTKADFDPKSTAGVRGIQELFTDKEKKDYLENENKSAVSLADNVRNTQGSTDNKIKAYDVAIKALEDRSNELLKINKDEGSASKLASERNDVIKNIIVSEKALLSLQQKQLIINTDRLKLSSKLNSFSLDLEDKIANQKPETRRGAGDNFIRRQEFADKNVGGSNNANLAIDNLVKTVTPLLAADPKQLDELKRQAEEQKSTNSAKDFVLGNNFSLNRDSKTSLKDQLEAQLNPYLDKDSDKAKEKFESLMLSPVDFSGTDQEISVAVGKKLSAFVEEYSKNNTQLKEAGEAEIRIREIMTKKVEESIGILEKKNELDKASVKSLLDGDVMSFIKGQQAQGAQAAIASGDKNLARSFGAQAIGGALQNAEDQKALGATSIYGMDINKFARSGSETGLALRGIKNPELEAAYAGETPELARQKNLLKNKELLLGEGLRTLGTPNLNQNIPSGYSPKNDIEAKKQSSNLNESAKTTGSTSTAATSASVNGSIITEKDLSNLATFTSSVKELSAAVEKLAQSKIQISLAPTQHMVNITGADILSAIGPEIERVAMKNIRSELAKYEEGKQRGK